ncbi:MAG: ferredoxin [Myxococcota bacterium]|nr:ferredoxin [Myxococcota bacterium]
MNCRLALAEIDQTSGRTGQGLRLDWVLFFRSRDDKETQAIEFQSTRQGGPRQIEFPRCSEVEYSTMSRRFEVIEEECIGCSLCSERAPGNLEIRSGSTTAQVFKQPETPEEEEACHEASDYCPTGGLKARSVDSASTKPQADTGSPALAPAGDSKPAGIAPMKLEN